MIIFHEPQTGPSEQCSYLPDQKMCTEFFFAGDLDKYELESVLCQGWRKFGCYFFRPVCENCRSCIPLRIPVDSFYLSKSQRRILQKNRDVTIEFVADAPLTDEMYRIYEEHSRIRFNRQVNKNDFLQSFALRSCPSLLSRYYLDNKLSAVGFLDCSSEGLSSVYFIYTEAFVCRSPGNFSILKEIEYAKTLGLKYYYLGYFVQNNNHMAYKGRFFPHERMCWENGVWERIENCCGDTSDIH